jgi:hypothetical protein
MLQLVRAHNNDLVLGSVDGGVATNGKAMKTDI